MILNCISVHQLQVLKCELNVKNKLKGTFFLNLLASKEEIVIQKSLTESTKQTSMKGVQMNFKDSV